MRENNITKFENLSNEILYIIFEHLPGEELFESFNNLNCRINLILNDPRLRIHIAFAKISYMQSLCDLNQIQFVNVTLSRSNPPMIAGDLQNCSVMPYASQLSINEIFVPDLIVGLSYIKSRMPNLIHVSIKTYNNRPVTPNNNVGFIIENLLDLPHLRTLSLNVTYNSEGITYARLSNVKQTPFLERLSIMGCNCLLLSIIDLMTNSPRLNSLQMKIERENECPDYSIFQQLTKASLQLIGFDDMNLKKFFRSMTNIVSLRLDNETLISLARLFISDSARITQIPMEYFNGW